MSSDKTPKIVFVLGAGFSFPALGFGQAGILNKLEEKYYEKYPDIAEFITEVYGHNANVPLEDIYTAMDRSIYLHQYIKRYSANNLFELRKSLNDLITQLVDESIKDKSYIDLFAKKLCEFRWQQYEEKKNADMSSSEYKDDRIALLSLNWDVLLDSSFGEEMDKNPKYMDIRKGYKEVERMMFMDFCMFDFNPNKHQNTLTSLRLKPAGFVNLKYLKLHGGMNWFVCPNCSGLYVNLEGFSYKYLSSVNKTCNVCLENNKGIDYKLERIFITPTFLKDFNSPHFKSIWWNAGYELAEATHIVFIGYSLPLADFDFKYLLAKYLPQDINIKVILSDQSPDYCLSRKNYKEFFGERLKDKSIYSDGVVKYVNEELIFENILRN